VTSNAFAYPKLKPHYQYSEFDYFYPHHWDHRYWNARRGQKDMDMVMATVKVTALVASSVGYIGYSCRTIGSVSSSMRRTG
jgi:hypothetical protein